MAELATLISFNKLPPVRCPTCNKLLADRYNEYLLLLKTLNNLVPQYNSNLVIFQKEYDTLQNQYLENIKSDRLNATRQLRFLHCDIDWEILKDLSNQYKIAQRRYTQRKLLNDEAVNSLKNTSHQNITPSIILERVVDNLKKRSPNINNLELEKLTLIGKLEYLGYRFKNNDPDWFTAANRSLHLDSLSPDEIAKTFVKIDNIPARVKLPAINFTDGDLKTLKAGYYDKTAMNYLGIDRECCRHTIYINI